MAKDPAFLFYTQDFQTGTQFFTDEQVGKYMRLLCAQHQHGHLSEKHMLSICKAYDEDVLKKFIKDEQGLFYNERLENEINKRKAFTESRRKNAKGEHKKEAYAEHMPKHMENENINDSKVDIDIGSKEVIKESTKVIEEQKIPFETFWDLYDKKIDKGACEKKWARLSSTDKEAIIVYLPKYKKAQPEKQYRKNPETFLNNRSWEDEIIESTPILKTVHNAHQQNTNNKLGTSDARMQTAANW